MKITQPHKRIMTFPSSQELEISVQELVDLSLPENSNEFRLIDCREEDEFAICRLENAELIPLSNFQEGSAKLFQNEDEQEHNLIIYCHHGMRSMQATNFLRNKGLTKVWSLAGGIDQWSIQIDSSVPRY